VPSLSLSLSLSLALSLFYFYMLRVFKMFAYKFLLLLVSRPKHFLHSALMQIYIYIYIYVYICIIASMYNISAFLQGISILFRDNQLRGMATH